MHHDDLVRLLDIGYRQARPPAQIEEHATRLARARCGGAAGRWSGRRLWLMDPPARIGAAPAGGRPPG